MSEKIEEEVSWVYKELLRRARLYQADDGTPGPLADQWGWRDMSEHLRRIAEDIKPLTGLVVHLEKLQQSTSKICQYCPFRSHKKKENNAIHFY